jgi:prepilin-type N-terminal cleavage/methylation domain-containing protein
MNLQYLFNRVRTLHVRTVEGFTLIELMMTVAVVSILTAMMIPRIHGIKEDAEKSSCRSNMSSLASCEEMHWVDNEMYTDDVNDLTTYIQNAAQIDCPACNTDYIIVSDGTFYSISCPNSTSHGYVADGERSWP